MSESQTRGPSYAQVIKAAINARMANVHTCIPGKVTRYDKAKQQADVLPLLKTSYMDEDETRVVISMPVITNVPVMFPGAGAYRVTFPVEKDEPVLLVFSEASLDAWLESGGEKDPGDDARFHLKDAIALVGLRDFAHAWSKAPTDAMTIGHDSKGCITVKGDSLTLTATGSGKIKLEIGDGIELGGSVSKLIKSAFVDDVKDLVSTTLTTILQGGTAGSPVKQQIVLAGQLSSATIATTSASDYKNDKVKHGS